MLIDLIIKAAKFLNAGYQPIQLRSIREKAISLDVEKRYRESSYDAELNFHTINMKSRFIKPQIKDENISAPWKIKPYFYRTSPGFYRLLSEEDKRIFKLALENNLDIIYKDEYPIEILYSRVKSLYKDKNINDGFINSDSKNIKTKEFVELHINKKVYSPRNKEKIYNDKEKGALLDRIGRFLIGIYNDNKIPKYLDYYNKCGFTVNNLMNNQNYLFRLLILASYDQMPYTRASKGWEPIWGISGSQKLLEILKSLGLFNIEDMKKLSTDSINNVLGKVTFFNYHIDRKNSISPQYAKTFKTIYRKIKEDSLLNKFIKASSSGQVSDLFESLKQIENIGETIASKIIMYVLREVHLNSSC